MEETDSLQSDEEDDGGQLLQGGIEYDSDEFADDEGMSNQDDSSSQEYLHDEPSYLDTVEQYRYANWDRNYTTGTWEEMYQLVQIITHDFVLVTR